MHVYAIAIGSNRCHGHHGRPEAVLRAALASLGPDIVVHAVSPIVATAPMGGGGRRFANAAALIATALKPPELLARLKQVERTFGRRRGRRWGSRVLDLDILLWSAGTWRSNRPSLRVPHVALAQRRFVLDPLVRIAPRWRLAGTGLRVAHARARLIKRG